MRHQPSTKNQDHQKNSNKKTLFHWSTYHLPLSTSQANKWTLYSFSLKKTWTSYWAWSKTTRCAWSEWIRYWGLSSTASNWVRNWTYYLTDFTINLMLKSSQDHLQSRTITEYSTEVISIQDPMTMLLIKVPVCSVNCLHRQCFDY
jgi:hypothetical protein